MTTGQTRHCVLEQDCPCNCWEWNGLGWTGGWGSGASVQVAQGMDKVTGCTAELHIRGARRSLQSLTYFHVIYGAGNVITTLRADPDEFGQNLNSYVCKTKCINYILRRHFPKRSVSVNFCCCDT